MNKYSIFGSLSCILIGLYLPSFLRYTATEAGEKEFLIQCKRMESTESFEDYRTIKLKVKNISKIEILNFECLSKPLIVGEKLEFAVQTNIQAEAFEKDEIVLLYKFYKITPIQTNFISYIESS